MRTAIGTMEVVGMQRNRRNHAGASVKALCWAVGVALLFLSQVCPADLPALRAPLLDTPATMSQFLAHLPGSSTTGPTVNVADVNELARGLKYDPGLMYKFVHDHIHFTPMWGEVKGPYLTWMDRSGNAFDQASLMIALLKHANGNGHTITNIKYQVGEIDLTSEQFCSWFGTMNNAGAAGARLARGGIYAEVSADGSGNITAVRLLHVWVKATIDSQAYEFDPSFKSHTTTSNINLSQAMGYNQTNFLADAEPQTGEYSKSSIRSDLASYTTSLISNIKTNHPNDDIREIIGGTAIDPVEETTMPPLSLPYTVYQRDQDFAIESIPNIYRTTLRIQHSGIDQTLYSSDIYGRRLSLKYNGSNQPQLILDGTVKATGNATTPGQVYDLILTVDHPYETSSFDCTATLHVKAGGFYQIVNGWGDTGAKILLKHRGLLEQYRLTLADTSEEVLGESYAVVGLTYLAKTSRMRDLAGTINRFALVNHHLLGVAGQYDAPYLDMAIGHLGVSHYGSGSPTTTEPVFRAVAGHASTYEHEVIRQLQDCNAVSTPRLFEMANDRGTYNDILTATSANWSSIQTQLVNWSQGEKDQASEYINAGFTVDLPQYGDLSEDNWTGMGFLREDLLLQPADGRLHRQWRL